MYLQQKTDRIRAEIDAGLPMEPAVSVAVPLLQAAADESREELQDLWAALLTTSLLPDGETRVRKAFFGTLKAMEPTDAVLLNWLKENGWATLPTSEMREEIERTMKLDRAGSRVSWAALTALDLVYEYTVGVWALTDYGREFLRACDPRLQP